MGEAGSGGVDRGRWITVERAATNNLRDVSVEIPKGALTVFTGVAGSGKSSLITGELPEQHPDFTVVGQDPVRGGGRSTPLSRLGLAERVRRAFAARSGLAPPGTASTPRAPAPCAGAAASSSPNRPSSTTSPHPATPAEERASTPRALATRIDGATIADVLAAAHDSFTGQALAQALHPEPRR
ncbi:hypothetical protein ACQEU3_41750 [Spirillospora sp. CA-253888]